MEYLEIAGTAVGLLYLYLEYKASVWLWVASIVMPAIYLVVYYEAGLYADFGISVYYLIASVYGLVCWLKGKEGEDNNASLQITHTPRQAYWELGIVTALLFGIIGYVLSRFTDSTVPWADAFTTSLSIVAMWMLARKYVEQWVVWIVADVACSGLYVYKDLWWTGGLYLLYAVIAVFGYRKWKLLMKNQTVG
ncbi:MAG: nicotinamide riboside transporter PnuC [Muribaculaceae bacterium]|nr:nicotinamide riboside transporter PnuC [Muribaculaceae bacterium]